MALYLLNIKICGHAQLHKVKNFSWFYLAFLSIQLEPSPSCQGLVLKKHFVLKNLAMLLLQCFYESSDRGDK